MAHEATSEAHTSELDALMVSIPQYSLQLEHSNQLISASLLHSDSLFQEVRHAPDDEHAVSKHESEQLRDALTTSADHLTGIMDALEHEVSDVLAAANTHKESLENSGILDELSSLAAEADQAGDACSSHIQSCLQGTEQTINVLGTGLAELESRAHAWLEHSASLVQQLTIQMHHEYSQAFEGLASSASFHLEQRIPQQVDIARESVTASLTNLEQWGSQTGSQLAVDIQQTMAEVADSAQDIFRTSVETAVQELIRNELQHLLEEIGAQTVVMEAGTEVTGALSPYLPYIIVIKDGLHVINQLIDALRNAENILPWNWFG